MRKNLSSLPIPLLVSIPLLVCALLSGTSVVAQSLSGTYINGSDSLVFKGDRIKFRVSEFGGLSTTKVGVGTYERKGDFLLVHTSDYTGAKATFQELDGSRSDTCVIKVVKYNNYPIQGILVEPNKTSRKKQIGQSTGSDGKAYLADTEKIKVITVSGMGYNTVTINYNHGHDYLVKLVDNEVIENKTVVFQFYEVDEETISILLLTDELDPGKKRDVELNKLEKKARKNNRIDKRFKKEYEPYLRNR